MRYNLCLLEIESFLGMNVFRELGEEVRPYFLHIAKHLIVYLLLLGSIGLSHWFGDHITVEDWAKDFLNKLHLVGTIVSFGIFMGLSIRDIWYLGKKKID